MNVNIKANLLGHIEPEKIMKYIYNNFDKNVKNNIEYTSHNYFDNKDHIKEFYDEDLYLEKGRIWFNYKDEIISLFYQYSSYNTYMNIAYYKKYGLENMVKSEKTFICSTNYGDSTKIIEELTSYFGGWINYGKYKNQPYYYIPSTQPERRKEFSSIIYMTQEELNKHFGGIVVIKNK